tara:strand:- start:85 stop:237 length:153 start_codon:yes stop_codon:yes gene_type:complete
MRGVKLKKQNIALTKIIKIMNRIPSRPSAAKAVLIGISIGLILYSVVGLF